jgi:hypothetical protein
MLVHDMSFVLIPPTTPVQSRQQPDDEEGDPACLAIVLFHDRRCYSGDGHPGKDRPKRSHDPQNGADRLQGHLGYMHKSNGRYPQTKGEGQGKEEKGRDRMAISRSNRPNGKTRTRKQAAQTANASRRVLLSK